MCSLSIVECSLDMKLPIDRPAPTYSSQSSNKGARSFSKEQHLLNLHCRPWMMVWKGQPHPASISTYERLFPTIEILKFCVDNGAMRVGELHDPAMTREPRNAVKAANVIAEVLMKRQVVAERSWGFEDERVPRLVYFGCDNRSGRCPVAGGRLILWVKAASRSGFRYDRHEWIHYGSDEDLSNAEGFLVSVIVWTQGGKKLTFMIIAVSSGSS